MNGWKWTTVMIVCWAIAGGGIAATQHDVVGIAMSAVAAVGGLGFLVYLYQLRHCALCEAALDGGARMRDRVMVCPTCAAQLDAHEAADRLLRGK